MRSRDYRRVRQIELVRFAIAKFGKPHWKVRLAAALGIHKNEMARWLLEDWCGRIEDRVEAWADTQGFRSVYAVHLEPVRHHAILMQQILARALERRSALERKEPMSNSILPFTEVELDQAFAALGFDLIGGG